MNDSLLGGFDIEELNIEFATILPQRLDLRGRNWISYGQRAISCRNIMIGSGKGSVWSTNVAISCAQSGKGLGRSDFMYQVQVNVEQRRPSQLFMDHVHIPEFFEEGAGHKIKRDLVFRPLAFRLCT
jgi:hypothetical protein